MSSDHVDDDEIKIYEVGNGGTPKLFMKHRTSSILVPEELSSPFCWETINGKTAFMTVGRLLESCILSSGFKGSNDMHITFRHS